MVGRNIPEEVQQLQSCQHPAWIWSECLRLYLLAVKGASAIMANINHYEGDVLCVPVPWSQQEEQSCPAAQGGDLMVPEKTLQLASRCYVYLQIRI